MKIINVSFYRPYLPSTTCCIVILCSVHYLLGLPRSSIVIRCTIIIRLLWSAWCSADGLLYFNSYSSSEQEICSVINNPHQGWCLVLLKWYRPYQLQTKWIELNLSVAWSVRNKDIPRGVCLQILLDSWRDSLGQKELRQLFSIGTTFVECMLDHYSYVLLLVLIKINTCAIWNFALNPRWLPVNFCFRFCVKTESKHLPHSASYPHSDNRDHHYPYVGQGSLEKFFW